MKVGQKVKGTDPDDFELYCGVFMVIEEEDNHGTIYIECVSHDDVDLIGEEFEVVEHQIAVIGSLTYSTDTVKDTTGVQIPATSAGFNSAELMALGLL